MSLKRVHLRKLLQIFYLPNAARTSLLRADIRNDLSKEGGGGSSGGDFYVPFWADVKDHVADKGDLKTLTQARINGNARRARLYPKLSSGFLTWWNEKRRWVNEPYKVLQSSIKTQLHIPSNNCVVKIENLLSVEIGDSSLRQIYPYFSENPALPEEGARIGLWVLKTAFPTHTFDEFRILDILRSRSFSPSDPALTGDEESLFIKHYSDVLEEWEKLRADYG